MIQSPLLSCFGPYIAGQWVGDSASKTLQVVNPATGETLAEVATAGEQQILWAIGAAESCLGNPATLEERRAWLNAIADGLLKEKQELGRIITLEHGKPIKEGIGEVEYSAGFFKFFATQTEHLQARELEERIRNCQWVVHHRAAGVAGLITPWNFPLGMLAKKLSAALGAGCAAVVKPASATPLSAIALFTILDRLKLPAGMVNLVLGPSDMIGEIFCEHPAVRVISFTGSTQVGKLLAQRAALHVKRLTMELGGNAPFIVFEDADLEEAGAGLIANKFRGAGQTCVCTNRVYVQEAVVERFTEIVASRVQTLRVGDGMEETTDIGPLINREGFEKVLGHLEDALTKGARLLVGRVPQKPEGNWGCFFPPTVISGVTSEMRVCCEETFGPLVAIGTFGGEEEVIAAANSTPHGLAAYVYTRDLERGRRVIGRLRFGHVGLNTGTGPTPEAPFGGMKQSGYGREGGLEGLLEFCETQVVAEGSP